MRIDVESGRAMLARTGGRRSGRPWLQLLNAVLTLAGPAAELVRHSETPWASVTFTGMRHSVVLSLKGADGAAAGEAFIAALPEHEFTLPGKLVADAAIVCVEQVIGPEAVMTIEAELLLLDDL